MVAIAADAGAVRDVVDVILPLTLCLNVILADLLDKIGGRFAVGIVEVVRELTQLPRLRKSRSTRRMNSS